MRPLLITLDRRYLKDTYSIGKIYLDGIYYGDTLEDRDRGLYAFQDISYIKENKVYGETAIPKGDYEVRMDIISPKYSAVKWYKQNTGGYMPRLMDVPGFEAILIHPGTTALDSVGCILTGKNSQVGKLTQSRDTFLKIWKKLKQASDEGRKIYIHIR